MERNFMKSAQLSKIMNLPCKYGINLHINSPNTKSRKSVPTSVNGIQKTPNRISETAKFNKNTFVMVRIRRFCTKVMITKAFPTMASNRIVAYNGIWSRPLESQSIHELPATVYAIGIVVVAKVVVTDALLVKCCWIWCCGNTDDS